MLNYGGAGWHVAQASRAGGQRGCAEDPTPRHRSTLSVMLVMPTYTLPAPMPFLVSTELIDESTRLGLELPLITTRCLYLPAGLPPAGILTPKPRPAVTTGPLLELGPEPGALSPSLSLLLAPVFLPVMAECEGRDPASSPGHPPPRDPKDTSVHPGMDRQEPLLPNPLPGDLPLQAGPLRLCASRLQGAISDGSLKVWVKG